MEFKKYNWDNKRFREMHAQIIKNDLQNVSILSVTDLNESPALGYVNGLCDKLCGIMHNAAKKSCDVVKQKCKSQNKNKWWTSDCSAAGKRSRLFFSYLEICWTSFPRYSVSVL